MRHSEHQHNGSREKPPRRWHLWGTCVLIVCVWLMVSCIEIISIPGESLVSLDGGDGGVEITIIEGELENVSNERDAGPGDVITWDFSTDRDLTGCRGMTWRALNREGNYTRVGRDGTTDAYKGDTPCRSSLPLLCINKSDRYPPPPDVTYSRNSGWSSGEVRLTPPVPGAALTSLEVSNSLCKRAFGSGWRMAEFHDGAYQGVPTGWSFWAYGAISQETRFWVYINDQPANPWNSRP